MSYGSTMGHVPGNDPMHVCDSCESTYTGTVAEIQKAGWKRHHVRSDLYLVLCDDCVRKFDALRKAAKAA